MYYPIIDKLKDVMSSLISQQESVSRLELTEPYVVRGTVTNPQNFSGTWDGDFPTLRTKIRNGQPGLFILNLSIPNTIELNVTVPIVFSGTLDGSNPSRLETALTYITGVGMLQFYINSNNTFSLNSIS